MDGGPRKGSAPCGTFEATSAAGWDYTFTVQALAPVKAGDQSVSYLITNSTRRAERGTWSP